MPNKQQQRARQQRQQQRARRNAPYDISQVLGPQALRQLVNSLTQTEIRPQVDAINTQIKTTRAEGASQQAGAQAAGSLQANRTNDYYTMLAKSMGQVQQGQQQAGQQYAANLQNVTAGTTAQIDQASNDRQSQLAQDMAVRGGGLQQNAGFESAIGAARVNAAQRGQDIKGLAASQNANYEGLINSMAGSTAMKGGEIQGQIASQTQANMGQIGTESMKSLVDLMGQKRTVQAQRGPLTAKNLLQVRDSEFNKLATMEGLNLDTAQLRERIRSAKTNEKLTAIGLTQKELQQRATNKHNSVLEQQAQQRINATIRGQNITVRGQDMSAEQRAADRALREKLQNAGGVAGLTPSELRKLHESNAKYRSSIRSVKSIIEGVLGTHDQHKTGTFERNKPGDKHFEWAQVKKDLNAKYKDADMVDAAFELWKYGHISNSLEQRLRERQIGIPKNWRFYSPNKP